MIDFRYHLASLMAVLIALTVGVILGAGPLQAPLSNTLNSEVSKISEEKSNLRDELNSSREQVKHQAEFINQIGALVSKDLLKGIPTAIVEMPGSAPKDVDHVIKTIQAAGGSISDRVKIETSFVNQASAAYRDQLSQSLPQYLDNPPAETSTAEEVLGVGLVQVLTSAGQKSTSIHELLTTKTMPLMQFVKYSQGKAKMIVVVGAAAEETNPKASPKPDVKDAAKTVMNDAITGFAEGLSATQKEIVIVGDAAAKDTLIAAARSNSIKLNTVDSIGTEISFQTIPLAIAAGRNGDTGNYGSQTGADSLVPSVSIAKK